MGLRPHTKKWKKARFTRCPKCQKQVRAHQRRCKTCHRVLKVA